MSENAKALLGKSVPWKKGVTWWIVLIEGAVAFGLGLYILVQPERAAQFTLQLLGGYLLIESLLAGYRGVRAPEGGADTLNLIAAGIGIIAGLLAVVFPWIGAITSAAAALILALGLLLVGGIGMYGVVRVASQGLRWDRFLTTALQIVLAILLFIPTAQGGGAVILGAIGLIALATGVTLLVYAYLIYRKRPTTSDEPNQDAPQPPPVTVAASEASVPAEKAERNDIPG
jgi:uncharacterized membrane protein HdeD (DUF308 family)